MEIINTVVRLFLGVTFIIFTPYFLYAAIWWFPIIFIGGIITGSIFKKDDLELLSPFIIFQMTFPQNKKVPLYMGLYATFLSGIGVYIFFSEGSKIWAIFACFIGIATSFGIILSFCNLRKKR